MKLTENRIRQLACPAGKTKNDKPKRDAIFFDDEQKGLAVRVTASGGKTYLAQYSYGGEKRRVPLGAVDAISLAKARTACAGIMGDAAHGKDPARERKEKAVAAKRKAAHNALTLDKLVSDWAALHLKGKRPRYAHEATRATRRIFGKFLDWPAAALDRKTVVRTLDRLRKAGSPIMANRAGVYIGSLYEWAVKRGTLDANPFTKLPRSSSTERDRVLTDDELRAVWAATEGGGAFNAIVRMLILTGQRREEVAGMMWGELSADLSAWTLPGARAKNGVTHVVPLSKQAQAVVSAQPRVNTSQRVFVGEDGGAFKGISRLKIGLDRASGVENWVLHDLRRTCATGLQKLGVRLEVTEACLNHVSGSRSGIVGVYQRHDWKDEKRVALQAWADRVDAIVEGRAIESASNVVALRA
jgi:integrase